MQATNVLIMNPLFSLTPEGELDVRLYERSFLKAMAFIQRNRQRVANVFMMADVPPWTSRASGIFKTKADARSRKGKFGLRHLGQFHPNIVNGYMPMMQGIQPEDIQVLTESRSRQLVRELPTHVRSKMPKCEIDGTVSCVVGHISCRAITAMAMQFCLTAGETNQLEVFIQPEGTRTEFQTMADGAMDVSRIFGHGREQLNLNFCE